MSIEPWYKRPRRRMLTVRFTDRAGRIRIIGAGYWRQGKQIDG